MPRRRVFMDANASMPISAEARAAVIEALALPGNASSVHAEGRQARRLVEGAREAVAGLVGARPENVVFTSGATEAAALALAPAWRIGRAHARASRLFVGATEHASVLAGGRFPAERVTRLPVAPDGALDMGALSRALAAHDPASGPFLLALMLANNETGVLHPVAEAAAQAKAAGGLVFCDAVQAAGRLPLDIMALGVDALALSAHKIGGPKGAGALVLADAGRAPQPLLTGGGQERGHRAGTENVAAIAGFGVAARLAATHIQTGGRLGRLRARLEEGVAAIDPRAVVWGAGAARLPNTVLFSMPGLSAETAVIALDLEGYAVSSGAACSSGKVSPSHVLAAMGADEAQALSGVRVSLLPDAAEEDVSGFLAALALVRDRIAVARAA